MNTFSLSPERTLSEIVANNYHTAAVFQHFGLDFCCHGKHSLAEVCQQRSIEVGAVLADLQECLRTTQNSFLPKDMVIIRFHEWRVDFLADFLVENHHHYTKQMLPMVASQARNVATRHGAQHPALLSLAEVIYEMEHELVTHLYEEEQVLFPYIKKLARADMLGVKLHRPFFGSVQHVIDEREAENRLTGRQLEQIREMTNHFTPPKTACNTHKLLFRELESLDSDLHQQLHLENNILFPRIVVLEHTIIAGE
jgi:regulator of cell morphogenesis and NO signaling